MALTYISLIHLLFTFSSDTSIAKIFILVNEVMLSKRFHCLLFVQYVDNIDDVSCFGVAKDYLCLIILKYTLPLVSIVKTDEVFVEFRSSCLSFE